MITIEVRRDSGLTHPALHDDGVPIESVECYSIGDGYIISLVGTDLLQNHLSADSLLPPEIHNIDVLRPANPNAGLIKLSIQYFPYRTVSEYNIVAKMTLPFIKLPSLPDVRETTIPSISHYFAALSERLHCYSDPNNEQDGDYYRREPTEATSVERPLTEFSFLSNGDSIDCCIFRAFPEEKLTGREVVDIIEGFIGDIDSAVRSVISPIDYANMLSTYFDFPNETKESCVQ